MTDIVEKYMHKDGSETVIKWVHPARREQSNETIVRDDRVFSIFVSSTVGCPYKCEFCQLTQKGVKFHKLEAVEIFSNVADAYQDFIAKHGEPRSVKLCWMGMGDAGIDPDKTIDATDMLKLFIPIHEVDVSTVSVTPKLVGVLNYMITEGTKVRLFYSLQSAKLHARDRLLPNVQDCVISLINFRRFEGPKLIHYVPLKDVNDTDEEVQAIKDALLGDDVQIRLLEYNPSELSTLQRSERLEHIYRYLESYGFDVKWQVSRGYEQNAACGQFL